MVEVVRRLEYVKIFKWVLGFGYLRGREESETIFARVSNNTQFYAQCFYFMTGWDNVSVSNYSTNIKVLFDLKNANYEFPDCSILFIDIICLQV